MPRRTPHEPIFEREKIIGSIAVGNTPSAPPAATGLVQRGSVAIGDGSVKDILCYSGIVYVLIAWDAGGVGLISIDASTPTAPVVLDTLTDASFNAADRGLVGVSSAVYLLGDDVVPVSISSPSALSISGTTPLVGVYVEQGSVAFSDVYCSSVAWSGYQKLDASSPLAPTLADTFTDFPPISNPYGIVAFPTTVLLVDGNADAVYSIDTAGTPAIINTLTDADLDAVLALAYPGGSWMYVDGIAGVSTIDVTDPDNPTLVSAAPVAAGGSYNLSIAANAFWLVVPGADGTLRAFDVSTPATPTLYDSFSGFAHRRIATNGTLFFTDWNSAPNVTEIAVWEVV